MKIGSLKCLSPRTALKLLIALASVLCSASFSFSADLLYTFDTDAQGFHNTGWSSGLQAIQATNGTGGWSMGSGGGPNVDFGSLALNSTIATMASTGNGHISFDMLVDGNSFQGGNWPSGGWYQLHFAGNSDGSTGWTQDPPPFGPNPVNANHAAGDTALYNYHFDMTFAQLGWQAGDSWFQLFWGGNSDAANPLRFYVDNVHIYTVPEPSLLSLAALSAGSVVVWLRRRRLQG
jgi:hypothetical protein